MKTTIEILQMLDLVYESNPLPIIESSVEPNGGLLNVEKALNNNPECWDVVHIGATELKKKTIIVNCTTEEWSKQKAFNQQIITRLIEAGHQVYYSTEQGFTQYTNPLEPVDQIKLLTPTEISQVLAKLNLPRDRMDLFDHNRLTTMHKTILGNPDLYFYFFNVLADIEMGLFDGIECNEFINRNFVSAIKWENEKNNRWAEDPFHKLALDTFDQQTDMSNPQFKLNQTEDNHIDLDIPPDIKLSFLIQHQPDFLKKLAAINLANHSVNLQQFLNQAENLESVSFANCELNESNVSDLPTTSLQNIAFHQLHIQRDLLNSLLEKSPHLSSLSFDNVSVNDGFYDDDLSGKTLQNLKTLSFKNSSSISISAFFNFLDQAKNIEQLDFINSILIEGKNFYIGFCQLPKLKKLSISGVWLDVINEFINSTPNLESISISDLNQTKYHYDLSCLEKYKKLHTLQFWQSELLPYELEYLFNQFQNMKAFSYKNCAPFGYDNVLHLEKNQLPELESLDFGGTSLNNASLINLIDAAPKLHTLKINKPLNFSDFLNYLSPHSLTSLKIIRFENGTLSINEIQQLIKIAPNLDTIEFTKPNDTEALENINWLKQSYPHLKLNLVEPNLRNNSMDEDYSPFANYSLDGEISETKSPPDLVARTLFKSKNHQDPSISDYHLLMFKWEPSTQSFTPDYPLDDELTPVQALVGLSNDQLAKDFDDAKTFNECVYGQLSLTKPAVNTWLRLPALSSEDALISYAIEHPDYEIKRHNRSGYYFIKFNKPCQQSCINYILKPGNNKEFALNEFVPEQYLQWISALSFNQDGSLEKSVAYKQLQALEPSVLLKALAQYCYFDKENASSDIKGNTIDILNGLIKTRAGVCRHRARLFVALARSFDLDAEVIANDIHEFVKVEHQKNRYVLDLGGGQANVTHLPMPDVTHYAENLGMSKISKNNDEQSDRRMLSLKPDNPFQTWNSVAMNAKNADELVTNLITSHAYTRQWLIFRNSQAIEALHQASLNHENHFFSEHLDTLKLQSLRISGGADSRVESPICQFIKRASATPEKTFTWFINWSDAKARHVGLNSVIDNEDRNLDGLKIPANVRIVVCSDQNSAAKMGDDFYSRFDAISQAPEIEMPDLPPIHPHQPIQETDVIIPSPISWQTILLGRPNIQEDELDIAPGALIHAAEQKLSKLRIQNPPFEDPSFRFFIKEVLAKKRFFFNGQWYSLPSDFTFDFAKPDLSNFPSITPMGMQASSRKIINAATYSQLFNQYLITSKNKLKSGPGFLEAHHSLELVVTDDLSELQWYLLLKEASDKKCSLSVKATPNVTIPGPLQASVTQIEPLANHNHLIVTNDLDDAEETWQSADSITITVDAKTSFNQLFFHISLNNKQFTGQETNLLQALKEGKHIILKGEFSYTLAQRLQSLFIDPPSIQVNGSTIPVNNLTLITTKPAPFTAIRQEAHRYNPEKDLKKLEEPIASLIRQTYQQLNIKPCHSHFGSLPTGLKSQEKWAHDLIERLACQADVPPKSTLPTSPEQILSYLDKHGFVFLTSKTGSGKSYFVQKTLQKYAQKNQRPVKIYYEKSSIKDWLMHEDAREPILFFDEANISHEQYTIFEAIAKGAKEIWFEGERYPLSNHKVIFAGNPSSYEGRLLPDLLTRYPNYFHFQGESLENIIRPLLKQYENPTLLFNLISNYYEKAQEAGLNISPRNAQMMCMRFFILKELPGTSGMNDLFLMRYAVLNELKALTFDKSLTQPIRRELKKTDSWKADKKRLKTLIPGPALTDQASNFVWTESRYKIAKTIELFLQIREKKIKHAIKHNQGINGILIEGEPGLGKSQLVNSILKSAGIDYVKISAKNPQTFRTQLLDAFHKGQMVVVEEFNTYIDETLLNALLSGYDLDGNPAKQAGFCIIGTQNPTTFHNRQPLSNALDNRFLHILLDHYSSSEFHQILKEKFKLANDDAIKMTEDYFQAKTYAKNLGFFPPPNPRNVMNQAEMNRSKIEVFPS